PLQVDGPMGRTVQDVAMLLKVIAGPDPRAPMASTESVDSFAGPLERDFKGVRIAWSPDLGGLPVEQSVKDAIAASIPVLRDLGCEVDEAVPDFSDADEVF